MIFGTRVIAKRTRAILVMAVIVGRYVQECERAENDRKGKRER